jgi:hypothetical protein
MKVKVSDELLRIANAAWQTHSSFNRRNALRDVLAAVIPAIQNAALERAAVVAETHQAEVQRNIDDNIAEVRDIQIMPLDNWPLIKARDWLKHTAATIRALKEGESPASFPQPNRKDGHPPCYECHLQPGEKCDVCGAVKHKEPTP